MVKPVIKVPDVQGRRALITGGDSGMGRAAAIAYAREGEDVAINYYPTEEPDAQEVIELMKTEGVKAIAIPGDMREEAFCQNLVAETAEQLGGLDILVSNAGRQQTQASIEDISTEQFDWTMKTNIYAPFWIIKAALMHMQPGSAIVATTSEQSYDVIVIMHRLLVLFILRGYQLSKWVEGNKILLFAEGSFIAADMRKALVSKEEIMQDVRKSALRMTWI